MSATDASGLPRWMYLILGSVIVGVLAIFAALTAAIPDTESVADDLYLETIDKADTAWLLVATALVLLMTPGLAFFYGGMVTSHNVIGTMMQSYVCMGVITVMWTVFTFSLAFGDDRGGVLGDPSTYAFYHNVGYGSNSSLASTIPLVLFSLFELAFAVITPAIISGAFPDRIKFHSWVLFCICWHILVYCPIAHSVWHPDGFLHKWGVLDFAGGTVVEMASGLSALVGSVVVGPGKDTNRHKANVPFILLGTGMLWFGWFGFNSGSALGANGQAAQAFLTTNMGGAASMLTWIGMDILQGRRPGATGACVGVVVGLVVLTPSCGFITVGGAFCMGVLGAIICFVVQSNFHVTGVDDTLDVFPCHGVGGMVGLFLLGFFATDKVAPGIANGVFYGGHELLWKQIVTICGVATYIVVVSGFIFKIIDVTIGLRVSEIEELQGLDLSQHGESLHGLQQKLQSAATAIRANIKGIREEADGEEKRGEQEKDQNTNKDVEAGRP